MHIHCIGLLHEILKESDLDITDANTKIELKDEVHDHSKSHPVDTRTVAFLPLMALLAIPTSHPSCFESKPIPLVLDAKDP